MADRRLEIHPGALAEIQAAVAWYQDRSQQAATGFVAELDAAIVAIQQSPDRWPVGVKGTRKLVLRRFPFAIVYRTTESTIQLLAVAHGSRRPGYWKKRT